MKLKLVALTWQPMRIPANAIARAILVSTLAACGQNSIAPDWHLSAARTRWEREKPASYDITVSRSCECTPAMTGPVVVSVRQGTIVSRTFVGSGAAVGAEYAELFPAIEGLFAKIDDARRRNAASVDVTYDSELGFPSTIAIDYERVMVDDEVTYRAYNFQRR